MAVRLISALVKAPILTRSTNGTAGALREVVRLAVGMPSRRQEVSLKAVRKILVTAAFAGLFSAASASAAPITIDTYQFDFLFDSGVSDPSLLLILADMGPAGDALRMALAQAYCQAGESNAGSASESAARDDESLDWECDGASLTPTASKRRRTRSFQGALGSSGGGGGGGSAPRGGSGGALQSIITNPFAADSFAGDSFADDPFAGDSIGRPPAFGGRGSDLFGGFESGPRGNDDEANGSDYLPLVLSGTVPGNLLAQGPSDNGGVPTDSPKPPAAQVPEPSSFLFVILAVAGLALMPRRRQQQES